MKNKGRKQGCKFSRIYLNFPKFTGIHLNLPKFTFFEKRVTHGRTDGWTKPLMEWHFATKKKKINADCWGPTKRSGIVISSGDVKCHLFLGSGKILSLHSAILPPPPPDWPSRIFWLDSLPTSGPPRPSGRPSRISKGLGAR